MLVSTYTSDYTSTIEGYFGLLTTILPAKSHGLDIVELPVNLTLMLGFLGEEEIVGTDVRRPSVPPYIALVHSYHVVHAASRLTSSYQCSVCGAWVGIVLL